MQKTTLICNNFSGISRTNSQFSNSVITAVDMQNVELFSSGVNAGIGIRTSLGNVSVCDLIPSDEEVIEIFESTQNQITNFFVYTESSTQGKIYLFDLQAKTLTLKVSGLHVTGRACGCDISQGWSDLFVFSNSEDLLSIELGHYDGAVLSEVTRMNITDIDGRTVKGLGMVNFAGRLWIFSNQILWYSAQENIYDFSTSDSNVSTSAGYIEFVKNITAIYPYLGTLAVFHKDSSCLIAETNGVFSKTMESPGGCAGYNSLVFHGTELYFYDDTKKGVFCFRQIVNGDKTLGENIALDLQEELCSISAADVAKVKALSVVTSDRNEVWLLLPSNDSEYSLILIFDYIRRSWVKRKSQKINCFCIVNGNLYSGGKKIYAEYSSSTFDGEFIEAFYKSATLNLGRENSIKALNVNPKISLDMYYSNNFYVEYIKNGNETSAKSKKIHAKSRGDALYFDLGNWDESFYAVKDIKFTKRLPVALFKTLKISFIAKNLGDNFCIKNIEFERIKTKAI